MPIEGTRVTYADKEDRPSTMGMKEIVTGTMGWWRLRTAVSRMRPRQNHKPSPYLSGVMLPPDELMKVNGQ